MLKTKIVQSQFDILNGNFWLGTADERTEINILFQKEIMYKLYFYLHSGPAEFAY
jgi:hypothetical protein